MSKREVRHLENVIFALFGGLVYASDLPVYKWALGTIGIYLWARFCDGLIDYIREWRDLRRERKRWERRERETMR